MESESERRVASAGRGLAAVAGERSAAARSPSAVGAGDAAAAAGAAPRRTRFLGPARQLSPDRHERCWPRVPLSRRFAQSVHLAAGGARHPRAATQRDGGGESRRRSRGGSSSSSAQTAALKTPSQKHGRRTGSFDRPPFAARSTAAAAVSFSARLRCSSARSWIETRSAAARATKTRAVAALSSTATAAAAAASTASTAASSPFTPLLGLAALLRRRCRRGVDDGS